MIDLDKIIRDLSIEKFRGNVSSQLGMLLDNKEKEKINERAKNTPHYDRLISEYEKSITKS